MYNYLKELVDNNSDSHPRSMQHIYHTMQRISTKAHKNTNTSVLTMELLFEPSKNYAPYMKTVTERDNFTKSIVCCL